MNIFKFILATFFTIWSCVGAAQGLTENKISSFNIAWGTEYVSNYVKNPSARITTQYKTPTNFNASLGSGSYENAGGWDLNATATGGFIEFDLHPFFGEDTVGNCTYVGYYNGTAANYKAQIVDGSGVELNKFQLSDVTSITPFAVVYPCGATGTRKIRIAYTSTGTGATFNAGRFTYRKYADATQIPDGASFYGGMEQVAGTGCGYSETTSSGTTNFVALGASTCSNAWTTTGKVVATAATNHRASLVTPGPGYYNVQITSNFYRSASGQCMFRLNDGTNTYQAQGFQGTTAAWIPVLNFTVVVTAQQASNLTLTIEASDDQTGCVVDNTNLGGIFSWKVFKYPLNGTAYTNVVPASCINNPDCQNNFSAKVSVTGVVSDENYSFINGNAALASSIFTLTWDTSRFSVAPNCVIANNDTQSGVSRLNSVSASNAVVVTSNASFTAADRGFVINCSRAGTDVKPWGPIPLLSGMVSSNSTSSIRTEYMTGVCSGSSSVLRQSTPGVFSVANISSGSCVVTYTGTWPSSPTCIIGGSNTSTTAALINIQTDPGTTSFTTYGQTSTSAAALTAYGFAVTCWGPR